ncbi:hypothetical protein GCM10023205_09470 [Yinghuangia aomiensis]|uniref:Uncharacterized protein n=1 Tax=Yinghuangia aomiensis TaxID=676205 RepID=A0ABP9GT22_9ACTN
MTANWRTGTVHLRDGYTLVGKDGGSTASADADFALEGGFVHVRIPGTDTVQIVSAPAVARITYAEAACAA